MRRTVTGVLLILAGFTGAYLAGIAPNEFWDFFDPRPGGLALPMGTVVGCLIVSLIGVWCLREPHLF
jgi:hypothetical protein